jgi:hypothetical protein
MTNLTFALILMIPALIYHQRLGDIARKFQSFFNLICCKQQLSGDLQGDLCNRDW